MFHRLSRGGLIQAMQRLRVDRFGWYVPERLSRSGLALVAVAHALVFIVLLRMPAIAPVNPGAVLSVSLLPVVEARQAREPAPVIVPPRPKSVPRPPLPLPVTPPSRLALPSEASAPSPETVSPAPPVPMVSASSTVASSQLPASAPVAVNPPRFDVDYLDNPKPSYPVISRRLGEQGRVVLRVRVDAAGLPLDVQLHTGSGSARLDQSALDTVRRWKFVPARLGNEPVAATVLVPIAFSLKD